MTYIDSTGHKWDSTDIVDLVDLDNRGVLAEFHRLNDLFDALNAGEITGEQFVAQLEKP